MKILYILLCFVFCSGQRPLRTDIAFIIPVETWIDYTKRIHFEDSVSIDKFDYIKRVVSSVADMLVLDKSQSSASIVAYGPTFHKLVLNLTFERAVFDAALANVSYGLHNEQNNAGLDAILNTITNMVFSFGFARVGVQKVVVWFTDGDVPERTAYWTQGVDAMNKTMGALAYLRTERDAWFYIIYTDPPSQWNATMLFFRHLVNNSIRTLHSIRVYSRFVNNVRYRIRQGELKKDCYKYEGGCRYLDENQTACVGVWWLPHVGVDEKCYTTQPLKDPPPCNASQCDAFCDKIWPYRMPNCTGKCGVAVMRRFANGTPHPYHLLKHCKKNKYFQCVGEDDCDEDSEGATIPLVIVAVLGAVVLSIFLALTWWQTKKMDEMAKTQQEAIKKGLVLKSGKKKKKTKSGKKDKQGKTKTPSKTKAEKKTRSTPKSAKKKAEKSGKRKKKATPTSCKIPKKKATKKK